MKREKSNTVAPLNRSIVSVKPNGKLADQLRAFGLTKIVDSGRVRNALGLPIRAKAGSSATSSNGQRTEAKTVQVLWQRLQVLREDAHENLENIGFQRKLASAEAEMGDFAEAARIWRVVQLLPGAAPQDYFAEAHALRVIGDFVAMRSAIVNGQAEARRRSEAEMALLGLGGYYQRQGDWDFAAPAYAEEIIARVGETTQNENLDEVAELAYRAGLAFDRCFQWAEAEQYYQLAIFTSGESDFRLYKLGLSQERQERWVDAAATYKRAVDISAEVHRKYRRYRAAYCLLQAELWEEACGAFWGDPIGLVARTSLVRSDDDLLSSPTVVLYPLGVRFSSQFWLAQASLAAARKDAQQEAEALVRAIDRSNFHKPHLFELAGNAFARLGDFKKAATYYIRSRLFQRPDGLEMKPYQGRSDVALAARYAEFRVNREVRERVVLFESYHGAKANCHPLAIFQEMLADPRFEDYLFVWSIRRGEKILELLRGHDNVVVVERDSDLFLEYLASAGTLITNVSFPPYFVRRVEQRYLNTWHGTPIKTLGKDIKPGYLEHANVARNFLQATHLISTCSWMTEVFLDKYDVRGLYTGKIAELGSPRSDVGLKLSDSRREELRAELGVPFGMPVVLYAPTWRGTQGKVSDDTELAQQAVSQLDQIGKNATVLFRGHHYAEKGLRETGFQSRLVPDSVETNELLAVVDVLITDYSSIFFDFLPFDRPIVFLTPDENEYREERGLYFEIEELPGIVCRDLSVLAEAVEAALGYLAKPSEDLTASTREMWRRQYAPHEDGGATRRTVAFVFDDEDSQVVPVPNQGPRVLLRSTLLPNGITTSVRNLIHSLGDGAATFFNINDPSALKKDEGRKAQFDQIPDHVIQLGRVGAPAYTPEERWVMMSFNRTNRFFSDSHRAIARKAYALEFQRIVGPAQIAAAVEFDGYAAFWVNLISAAKKVSRKVVYQHNDLFAEWSTKYPELSAVFSEYSGFDEIVSVSPSIRDVNRTHLAAQFGVDPNRFTHALNQINPPEVQLRAREPIDDDIQNWLDHTDGHLFVTIGRLSVEKAQGLLLDSFAAVTEQLTARLVVIGSGPLMDDLQAQAKRLGVERRVLFTGQRASPMGILKRADTFVLTSRHEGQPMVLGEAIMLGVSVIATDLPGTRDLLENSGAQLVPHEVETIADAMKAAVAAGRPEYRFDAEAYMREAVNDFSRVCQIEFELVDPVP